jgi:hypothetical protein
MKRTVVRVFTPTFLAAFALLSFSTYLASLGNFGQAIMGTAMTITAINFRASQSEED